MPRPLSRRPAWVPLAVLVAAAGGTWALAQPPGGFRPPMGPMGPPGGGPPQGMQPPRGYQPPQGGPPQGYQPPQGGPPPGMQPPAGPPGGGEENNPGGFPRPGVPNRPGGPGAGMGPGMGPGMGGPVFEEQWQCQSCRHTWAKTGGPTPEKCPKCGVRFTHVVNQDGTKTSTSLTKSGIARIIGVVVGLLFVGVFVLVGIIKAVGAAGSKKPRRKVKRRRPRDDYDD